MDQIKQIVKEKYGQIAEQSKSQNEKSCCGSGASCFDIDYSVFNDNYSELKGYNPDADLGLGCGLPTAFARIKEGNTVIDLGSGAGNDCFVARAMVGESGKVIGIDMTEAMIEKAQANNRKMGYANVEFRLGDIEKMPVTANKADVILSNCVLNLVPDKNKAFGEIFRVLKPGGHFSISDIVLKGKLPDKILNDAVMYVGCVSGAVQMDDYLDIISENKFVNVKIEKEKQIEVPDEILSGYLNPAELDEFKKSGIGIFSITVYAEKPTARCSCGSC